MNNLYKREIEIEKEIEVDCIDQYDENSDITSNIEKKPFDPTQIKISNTIISLESLIKRLQYDEIDLNPDFQRNADLWNKTKMCRLIESIILRLPLPIFYFDVSNSNKWVVIDGLQRLSTIKKFIIDKKLRLNNLEFLKELNGKSYGELERNIQRTIEETQIVTYQMEPQTPKEVRYSIFNRINTGGLTLNPQEIRQALNQKNNGVKFLKSISEDTIFKTVVNINSQRMIDRELVLRYLAFKICHYRDFYHQGITLATLLDNTMELIDSNDVDKNLLLKYKKDFFSTLECLDTIFDRETLFNKKLNNNEKKGTLNRSLFEIWTVLVSNLKLEKINILISKKDELHKKYIELLSCSEFDDAITKGTNDRKVVFKRFELLENLLMEILR